MSAPEGSASWTSLSKVNAPLDVGVDLGVALEERWSEVVPTEHSNQIRVHQRRATVDARAAWPS